MGKWPYAHSKTSPHIAVCTPAFLGNFIKGPNILEEELFGKLETLVLDEVRTYDKLFARQFSLNSSKTTGNVVSNIMLIRRTCYWMDPIKLTWRKYFHHLNLLEGE